MDYNKCLMSIRNDEFIKQLLLENQLISPSDWRKVLNEVDNDPKCLLLETLVKLNIIEEDRLYNFIFQKINLPYLEIKEISIPSEAIKKNSAKFASYYKLIPIDLKENTLILTMANLLDIHILYQYGNPKNTGWPCHLRGSITPNLNGRINSVYKRHG